VLVIVVHKLLKQGLVGGFGEVALLIQEEQQTNRFLRDEINTRLVVDELNLGPVDALAIIFLRRKQDEEVDRESQMSEGEEGQTSCSSLKMCWLKKN